MPTDSVVVGLRGSNLSQTQGRLVAKALEAKIPEAKLEFKIIKSSGDIKRDLPESTARDKKDWIIELEEALIEGSIDLAIHSGKDVPVDIHQKTILSPVLEREDPRDAIIFSNALSVNLSDNFSIKDIPVGARIGTASPRRGRRPP